MLKFMLQAVLFLVPLAALAHPAVAASEDSVIGVCSALAASNTSNGACVSATQEYLVGLKAEVPTLSNTVIDSDIADLVVKLAGLVPPTTCTAFNTEIGKAIATASSYSTSQDQVARLREISTTVQSCQTSTTASIGVPGTPSTPNFTLGSLNSLSQSDFNGSNGGGTLATPH